MAQFQHHIWPSWQCWHGHPHTTPSLSNTHTPNLELPLALSCQQPYQNQYKLSCQNFRFNDLCECVAGARQDGAAAVEMVGTGQDLSLLQLTETGEESPPQVRTGTEWTGERPGFTKEFPGCSVSVSGFMEMFHC